MRRSAYALIAGTGLTSLFGVVFWLLAARLLPPEAVGTGTALTSAMTFLATLSTLGLRNSLVRFLAPAGVSARRLIVTCYLLCAAAAMLGAVIFIAGQPLWASKLDFLQQDRLIAFAFVAATTVWVLFVLEDHVLIGLRRANWVPVTNGIYSGIKIAVLPALLSSGGYALLAAYALPAAPIVVVVTIFVLWITSPRRRRPQPGDKLDIAHLVRFATADHFSTLLWLATIELLTLVVLQQAGAAASAYYFMSFTTAYVLYLITSNIGSAFVAEGARNPQRAGVLAGEALRHAAVLVIPLAFLGVLVAPVGLALLGHQYATNATVLLRLLLLSAIPQVVIGISLGAARVRRDNHLILAIYAAQAIGVFGGTALTIGQLGLTGVGLAWLITQTAVALVLILMRRTGVDLGGIDLEGPVRLVGRLVSGLRRRRSRRQARRLVPAALSLFGLPSHTTDYRLLPSESDSLIVSLPSTAESAVIKIATSAAGSRGLDRHAEMVSRLKSSLDPSGVTSRLPLTLRRGTVHGYTGQLESELPGTSHVKRPYPAADIDVAAVAISDLHRITSRPVTVDSALLSDWVDSPIAELQRIQALDDEELGLRRLAAALHGELLGQHVTTSYVHGDYWLGNVLLQQVGGLVQVSGIVDWEDARPVGLPECDLIHLWLTSQAGELGVAVRRAVLSPDNVRDGIGKLPVGRSNPQLSLAHLVLLTWLWHVTAELQRASRNRVGRLWLARNVKPVLKLVSAGVATDILDGARAR
jgi:O-antigen/teichoic acid export membrane protein